MVSHLYFIKLFDEALTEPDPRAALERAIARITDLGQRPEYSQGYQQYLRFMELVRSELGIFSPGITAHMQIESADQIKNFKALMDGFEPNERLPRIIIERDGDRLSSLVLDSRKPVAAVDSVQPGNYSIGLDTGRRLWQGQLTEQDLIWREAFPDEPLPLAADTDDEPPPASREIELLSDELWLRIVPGRRHGRLEIIYLR